LLRANNVRNPVLRLLRRAVLSLLTRLPPVQQRLIATVAEDTISYTSSSLAKGAGASHPAAGTAFPDVGISISGVTRPATDLLRGGQGTFGSLVLLGPPAGAATGGSDSGDSSSQWPTHWGHWPLHVVSVAQQQGSAGASGAVDALGLLAREFGGAEGVLVRPDGIIAAAGGPQEVHSWLSAHGFAPAQAFSSAKR
jgi:hypothetical protein